MMPASAHQSQIPRQAGTANPQRAAGATYGQSEKSSLLHSYEKDADVAGEEELGEEVEHVEETVEEEEVDELRQSGKRGGAAPHVTTVKQRTKKGVFKDRETGKTGSTAEFQYASLQATAVESDGARNARRRALGRRENDAGWFKWMPLTTLALIGLSAFYILTERELFTSRKSALFSGDADSRADLRIFDLLRNAGVAPRFTLLEKIDNRKGWLLQMDVPGFTRNEINLYSNGPIMKIRGTHACASSWRGRDDPTCIERHISEEIRFPEEADMDTAQASMDHGVLRVTVKPNAEYRPRGRVVQIMDQAFERVQSVGENLKEKLGLNAHNSASESLEAIRERAGKLQLTGSEAENAVREKVETYLRSLQRAFQVPAEKQAEFVRRVRSKVDDLIQQFRKKALTAEELRDRIFDVAEKVWSKLREEVEEFSDNVKYKASQIQNKAAKATGAAKAKGYDVRETIAEKASQLKQQGEQVGQYVVDTVQGTVEGAKDKAQEYADKVAYQAEHAVHRVEEAASVAGHRAGEQLEIARDSAKEAARYAVHQAGESAERIKDRIKENTHAASHRADEAYERVQDRARENAHYAQNRAEENIIRSENRAKEATYGARAKVAEATEKSKGFAEAIKEKLGWAYQRAEQVIR